MAPASILKKRKSPEGPQHKSSRPRKVKKQLEYHSSSDDDEAVEESFKPVNLADSDNEAEAIGIRSSNGPSHRRKKEVKHDSSTPGSHNDDRDRDRDRDAQDSDENDGPDDDNDGSSVSENDSDASAAPSKPTRKAISKRNDPAAFSTSIAKILSSKLSALARADPVLSRSKEVAQQSSEVADEKLDRLARAKLRAEKKEALDRGRIRDVMGVERGQAGDVAEEEKRLRKVAQRGVIKLFNAVRAAQLRGEQAAKEERQKGTIGIAERQKAVNEVSKQSFLELISGRNGKPADIEAT